MNFRFDKTDKISISNTQYRPINQTTTHVLLARSDDESIVETFTHAEMAELCTKNSYRHCRRAFDSHAAKKAANFGCVEFLVASEEARSRAIWMWFVCWHVKQLNDAGELKLTDQSLEESKSRLFSLINQTELDRHYLGRKRRSGEKLPLRELPSARTIRRNHTKLKKAHYDVRVLLRREPSALNPYKVLPNETEELLDDCIRDYASPQRPSKGKVARETLRRFNKVNRDLEKKGIKPLHCPSMSTVVRRINKLDPFETTCRRDGLDSARMQFATSHGGIDVQFPYERIEIDEWECDVRTFFSTLGILRDLPEEIRKKIPAGRRQIYVAIDCATRCIVGLHIAETQSAEGAKKLLKMIVSDKTHFARAAGAQSNWAMFGGISTIACDTGPAFCSNEFMTAVNALHGDITFPPVKIPELRGRIERLFGTFASDLMPHISGRTFSNPKERGNYDSEGQTALEDDDLLKILTCYVVDYYHNRPHGSLGGQTPANRWRELQEEMMVSPPPDAFSKRNAFGVEFDRSITGRGVCLFSNYYSSPELETYWRLRKTKKKIRVILDPDDIGHVSVLLDGKLKQLRAVNIGRLDGLALSDWVDAQRALRQRYAEEAELSCDIRDAAIERIIEINQNARIRAKLTPQSLSNGQIKNLEQTLSMGAVFWQNDNACQPSADGIFGQEILSQPQLAVSNASSRSAYDGHDDGWGDHENSWDVEE